MSTTTGYRWRQLSPHPPCIKKFCKPFKNWIEGLFNDLFNDFHWSSDLRAWLFEVCDFLNLKATTPERFVPHRWLSVYDISLDTIRLLEAYILFYFGFLDVNDQALYKEKVEEIITAKCVSLPARKRMRHLQQLRREKKKTLTSDGTNRKLRIIKKRFYQADKTQLILHFYAATLKSLKDYVCLFQSSDTLVYQVHVRQASLFREFLFHFIKAEEISSRSDKELTKINLEESIMPLKDMFLGAGATKVINKRPGSPVVKEFFQ